MSCQKKFIDFISSGDKTLLEKCVNLIDLKMFDVTKMSTLNDTCVALVKKAKKDKQRKNQREQFTLYGNYLNEGYKSYN